ncbi:MAG: 2-phospho-L-lactate transferase CofD family protein [Solirubrobacteraceae bacterium]
MSERTRSDASPTSGPGTVVVLAGGTGGAKLARGMLDVVGSDELVVIANTGDDIDIYGSHVSPDPDLVSFWLADIINERGWGIDGDTFAVMDALRAFGTDVWFNLGDRDLAWCLERRRMEDEGLRPTEALATLNEAIGLCARVLPMCDEQVRTHVRTDAGWRDFQQFMIRDRAEGRVHEVAFATPAQARLVHAGEPLPTDTSPQPTPEVLAALSEARAVLVGPSNPVISIWPILHVLDEARAEIAAPVVCVSPIVGGEVVKGPTAAFLAAYDQPVSAAGVVAFYEQVAPDLLDGLVADEPTAGLATLEIDTNMPDVAACARVAEQTLAFAETLSG